MTDLDRKIFDASWAGHYFGREGALRLARQRFNAATAAGKRVAGLSAMSSTYYSASGHARARMSTATSYVSKLVWGVRSAVCLIVAQGFSDEFAKSVGGVDRMTVDEISVRARILLKCWRPKHAYDITRNALQRDGNSVDTQALLHIAQSENADALYQDEVADLARSEALKLAPYVKPGVAARIFRSVAEAYKKQGQERRALEMARKALDIATANGLDDQFVKILPLFK